MERRMSPQGVGYLISPLLEGLGIVKHAFSTKIGGESGDDFEGMNFSFTRTKDKAVILDNYRKMAEVMDVDPSSFVLSYQTHTTNVLRVKREDGGIFENREYRDVDGLISNDSSVTLVTFYADCIPLYFVDVKNKAIGLSHSGWRGTLCNMAKSTLDAMHREFATEAKDVYACIGPGICKSCYEVDSAVYERFAEKHEKELLDKIFTDKGGGKYLLDLKAANEYYLMQLGVRKDRIEISQICTCHNEDYLFSHRKHGEKRGNLAAFLALR